jgi:hypothetical protein
VTTGLDLAIALGLVVIAVIVFLVSRMGVLPKKTLPYVLVALAGALGLAFFDAYRRRTRQAGIAAKEEELKAREARLEKLKQDNQLSERKTRELQATVDEHEAAYAKNVLQIDAKTQQAKDRIDALRPDEAYQEFRKRFGASGQ